MKNNRGMATLETIALITVFSTLVSYALGMFIVIHTGILNSIAARTYAWETFAHRTNVTVFREGRVSGKLETDGPYGHRAHFIVSEKSPSGQDRPYATERYIASVPPDELIGRDQATHAKLGEITVRERSEINPVWIRTVYGICLNAQCGD